VQASTDNDEDDIREDYSSSHYNSTRAPTFTQLNWGTEHPQYGTSNDCRIEYSPQETAWILRVFNTLKKDSLKNPSGRDVYNAIHQDRAAVPVFHVKHILDPVKIKDKVKSMVKSLNKAVNL
jgi:hypothetical protein